MKSGVSIAVLIAVVEGAAILAVQGFSMYQIKMLKNQVSEIADRYDKNITSSAAKVKEEANRGYGGLLNAIKKGKNDE